MNTGKQEQETVKSNPKQKKRYIYWLFKPDFECNGIFNELKCRVRLNFIHWELDLSIKERCLKCGANYYTFLKILKNCFFF